MEAGRHAFLYGFTVPVLQVRFFSVVTGVKFIDRQFVLCYGGHRPIIAPAVLTATSVQNKAPMADYPRRAGFGESRGPDTSQWRDASSAKCRGAGTENLPRGFLR